MKKTIKQNLSRVIALIIAASPAAAAHAAGIFNSKNGFYGGAEVGTVNADVRREDVFKEMMSGTDVDFSNVISSINAYIDNQELRKCGGLRCPINRITIDSNSTFSNVASFNTFFGTIASKDSDFLYTPVASLDDFYDGLSSRASHTVGLLERPDDRAYLIRLFGGYNFKSFFGVEFGGIVSTDISTRNRPITFSYDNGPLVAGATDKKLVSSSIRFESVSNLYGVEFMGKAHLPLHPFYGYVKAGIAYIADVNQATLRVDGVVRTESTESGSSDEEVEIYNESVSRTIDEIRPVIAAGVALRAGSRAVIHASLHYYERTDIQPKLEVAFLGITLEFNDTMCGDLYC